MAMNNRLARHYAFDEYVEKLFYKGLDASIDAIVSDSLDTITATEGESVQIRTIRTIEDLSKLSGSSHCVLLLRFRKNSNLGLACSHSLFKQLMAHWSVHDRLKDFVACFRRKDRENDFAHLPCFVRQLNGDLDNVGQEYECMYGLRYPAQRDEPSSTDDILANWSLRPLTVYQKSEDNGNRTRWIVVGIPPKSEFEILLQEYLRGRSEYRGAHVAVHVSLFSYCISQWKSYLAELSDVTRTRSQEFLFPGMNVGDKFESRRQKLKDLEDKLYNLPLIFKCLRTTFKKISDKLGKFCNEDDAIPYLEQLIEETKLLQTRVEILEKQIRSISAITWDFSVHHNSKSMMRIAEDTMKDSAAMKIITVITVFFLPATFVATFFSMQFINVSDNEVHISGRTWIYFAVTVPLTILTILVWQVGTKADVIEKWLHERFNQKLLDEEDQKELA